MISGAMWVSAAAALDLPFVRTVVVGTPAYQDLYCDWRESMEIDEGGVILVRPDGYVAWRHFEAADDDAKATSLLCGALKKVLGRDDLGSEEVRTTGETFEANFEPYLFA